MHMRKPEENSVELILSPHLDLGSRYQAQVSRLCAECMLPLDHHTGPIVEKWFIVTLLPILKFRVHMLSICYICCCGCCLYLKHCKLRNIQIHKPHLPPGVRLLARLPASLTCSTLGGEMYAWGPPTHISTATSSLHN